VALFGSNYRHLIVKGVLVDVITELSVKRELKNDESDAKSWAGFLFPRSQEEIYISGGTVSNAADHAMCSGHRLDKRGFLTRGVHRKMPFLHCLSSDQLLLDFFTGDGYIDAKTIKSSLVWTRKGYLGMTNDGIQVGDHVCIVFGCPVPLLLRPAGPHWKIVENMYVHGIMDGEAVGPDATVETFEII
jgi:hypothetical protein